MSVRFASTAANGLLAGLSCLVTAYVIEVPIWAVFIAWASLFAAGPGWVGARKSYVMLLTGALVATVTLLVIDAFGGSTWAAAGCVVFGAGFLVAIGDVPLFTYTPASFFGFASIVGICAATGTAVTDPVTFDHPSVTALVAISLGTAFGLVAVAVTTAFSKSTSTVRVNS